MHVGTIIFYLLLTLCGQLGSSNPSVTNNLSLIIYTFSADPSFLTYDSSLSFLVICLMLHRCGVLVPTGTVHSNNEFEI